MIIELIVLGFNLALRRWKYLLAPLLVAIPAAYFTAVNAPKTYESNATILLSPAMQPGRLDDRPQTPSVSAEQIRTLELWLKSDRILSELVRKIYGDAVADRESARNRHIADLRQALTLQLNGRTVLELRMTDNNNVGLGRKLEIVLSRLMESLIEPDRGILTGGRLLMMRAETAERDARLNLEAQIKSGGLPALENSINILDQIHKIKIQLNEITNYRNGQANSGAQSASQGPLSENQEFQELNQDLTDLRKQLTEDTNRLTQLEQAYQLYYLANIRHTQLKSSNRSYNRSYLATIGEPEKLVIVGRPSDPVTGRSAGLKFAALIVFAGMALGVGLALLFEYLSTKIRTRDEIENLSNLMVVARLPRLPKPAKPI
ncbi:MAG: hypothetical protein AAGB04_04410 [Pseudomonadota bacterium]